MMEQIRWPVKGDIEGNWNALLDYVGNNVDDYGPVLNMLEGLEADTDLGDGWVALGFKHAPAGVRRHHGYISGLLTHVMEMLSLAADYLHVLEKRQELNPYFFNANNITLGVLYHDLHKAYMTFASQQEDLIAGIYKVKRLNHSTTELMSPDVKTLHILNQWGVKTDPLIVNAVLNAEDGWRDIDTRWCSSLAKFINLVDDSSSNILSRAADNTEYNSLVVSDKPWEQTYFIK